MHVIVSGAGIAGPVLAYWLAKANIRVTVLEKATSLQATGQNIDIDGTARKIVQRMGLGDEIRRWNTNEIGCRFIDPKGRAVAPFPMKKGLAVSGTSELEILRGDLVRILFDATKDLPGVTYLFGTTIDKVLANNEDLVEIVLSNGSTRKYDILVAADGQWSRTRKQCFPPENVTIRDMNMMAIYGTISRLSTDDNWWDIYQALGKRTASTRPDPHGTLHAMLTCVPLNDDHRRKWHDASHADRRTQLALVCEEFSGAGWMTERIVNAFEKAPDFYFHVIQQVSMKKWSENRVVCIGDAAYAPSPLAGGGTPLAILGAYILAGELAVLGLGQHPRSAFEAYENMFRAHVEEVQDIPQIMPKIVHPTTKFHRWLIQSLCKLLSRIIGMSWVASRLKMPEDDFELPFYPLFEEKARHYASSTGTSV